MLLIDPKVFWKLTAISAFMVFSAMSLFILSGPYYSKLELSEMTKVTVKYEPLKVEMKVNVVCTSCSSHVTLSSLLTRLLNTTKVLIKTMLEFCIEIYVIACWYVAYTICPSFCI